LGTPLNRVATNDVIKFTTCNLGPIVFYIDFPIEVVAIRADGTTFETAFVRKVLLSCRTSLTPRFFCKGKSVANIFTRLDFAVKVDRHISINIGSCRAHLARIIREGETAGIGILGSFFIALRTSLHNSVFAKAHIQGRATHVAPAGIDRGSSIEKTDLTHNALLEAAGVSVAVLGCLALVALSGFPDKQGVIEVQTLHLGALIVDLHISRDIKVFPFNVAQVTRGFRWLIAALVVKFILHGVALVAIGGNVFPSQDPFKVSTCNRLPLVCDKRLPIGLAPLTKRTALIATILPMVGRCCPTRLPLLLLPAPEVVGQTLAGGLCAEIIYLHFLIHARSLSRTDAAW